MRIALIQRNFHVGNIQGNADKIKQAIKSYQGPPVDLFITSELALTGYPPKDLLLSSGFLNQASRVTDTLAKSLQGFPPLLLGTIEKNTHNKGKPLFNSCLFLHDGMIQASFQKTLLPSYDVFDENRYFETVESSQVLEFQGLRIGITICEDVWNDDDIQRSKLYQDNPLDRLRQDNIDILLNLSASPFAIGKQVFRESMLSKIAVRSSLPVLFINQCGGNDDLIFDGNSCAFDAEGSLIARALAFNEDILTLDLDDKESNRIEPEMGFEEKIITAISTGTRDYIRKCGFSTAVLGLSGGIDSALTAFFAVEALGKDQVQGLLMPSPYSSGGSLKDADQLGLNLGIQTHVIAIEPVMKAFDLVLKPLFSGTSSDVTEENLQARIRGNLLMAASNKFNSILLSTGNKSELAVGYCTIYGDMSGGLAVISDLPKTLVYRLCKWINKTRGEIIPQSTMLKEPSAELRPNQKDQDTLPDYTVLDEILQRLVEQRQSKSEIAAAGFEAEVVSQVMKLVKNAEFKRFQAAPGLKVTDQAFGTGWRMPISAKSQI